MPSHIVEIERFVAASGGAPERNLDHAINSLLNRFTQAAARGAFRLEVCE